MAGSPHPQNTWRTNAQYMQEYIADAMQPSMHIVWGSGNGSACSSSPSSVPPYTGVETTDKRKKIKNQKLAAKGELPANVEVLTPSEDLTSPSDSLDDHSEEHRGSRSLEVQQFAATGHVVFASSSESVKDSNASSENSTDLKTNDPNDKPKKSQSGAPPTGKSNSSECCNQPLPSIGSALHPQNQCKPCLFFFSDIGCQNEQRCEFCHLPHTLKGQSRAGKGKRDRYRKLINRLMKEKEPHKTEARSSNEGLRDDDAPLLVTL